MQLIEDNGLVSLYRGSNDQIIVSYQQELITLQHFTFNYSFTWNPIIVDIYEDPSSDNDGNILMLWATTADGNSASDTEILWQALSFSSQNGRFVGAYDTGGIFRNDDLADYEFSFSQFNYHDLTTKIIKLINLKNKKVVEEQNKNYILNYLAEDILIKKLVNILKDF